MKQGYLGVQSTCIVIYSFSSKYIVIYSFIYIHCNLFDPKKVFDELTTVYRRRRLPCMCGRAAATAEEEAGSSSVDSGDRSRERQSRESTGNFESFGMKSEAIRGQLIFIGFKISEAVLNQNCC
jgi:hypothetical protein